MALSLCLEDETQAPHPMPPCDDLAACQPTQPTQPTPSSTPSEQQAGQGPGRPQQERAAEKSAPTPRASEAAAQPPPPVLGDPPAAASCFARMQGVQGKVVQVTQRTKARLPPPRLGIFACGSNPRASLSVPVRLLGSLSLFPFSSPPSSPFLSLLLPRVTGRRPRSRFSAPGLPC